MRETERTELLIDLRRACEQLTPRQRQVMMLALRGYTQGEISGRLGITQPAVCYHWQAARRKLEQLLK